VDTSAMYALAVVMLAPVTPEKMRPTKSQNMVGASAWIKKLNEKPSSENRMIGLRPYLSLKPPRIDAKMNCIAAYAKLSQPPYLEATLRSELWMSSCISLGTTGITIPQPVISMRSVIKMKPTAADF